jgi:hypothetical protein
MDTGQANNEIGEDLEPATMSDEMGDNFSFRRQQSATATHTLF